MKRRCQVCNKPLNSYNRGPMCHACDFDLLPKVIQGIFKDLGELDRINAERMEQRRWH